MSCPTITDSDTVYQDGGRIQYTYIVSYSVAHPSTDVIGTVSGTLTGSDGTIYTYSSTAWRILSGQSNTNIPLIFYGIKAGVTYRLVPDIQVTSGTDSCSSITPTGDGAYGPFTPSMGATATCNSITDSSLISCKPVLNPDGTFDYSTGTFSGLKPNTTYSVSGTCDGLTSLSTTYTTSKSCCTADGPIELTTTVSCARNDATGTSECTISGVPTKYSQIITPYISKVSGTNYIVSGITCGAQVVIKFKDQNGCDAYTTITSNLCPLQTVARVTDVTVDSLSCHGFDVSWDMSAGSDPQSIHFVIKDLTKSKVLYSRELPSDALAFTTSAVPSLVFVPGHDLSIQIGETITYVTIPKCENYSVDVDMLFIMWCKRSRWIYVIILLLLFYCYLRFL